MVQAVEEAEGVYIYRIIHVLSVLVWKAIFFEYLRNSTPLFCLSLA